MILEELKNKDERIMALEAQNATILSELADQKLTNNAILAKLDQLFPYGFPPPGSTSGPASGSGS